MRTARLIKTGVVVTSLLGYGPVVGAPVVLAAVGQPQTPAATDQQIFNQYIGWLSGLPLDARKGDTVEPYRAVLKDRGLSDAEIARQVAVIQNQEARAEADRWNAYFTSDRPRFNTMPNAFLLQIAEGRTPGSALDVGMGQGRNSIWLARQGWKVTGFDPADQAIEVAKRAAASLGLVLDTKVATDETFDFGENRWDLILLSYEGCGLGAEKIERALKPGGVVVVESFHEDAMKGRNIGGSICKTGELPGLFRNLRTIFYAEPIAVPDFAQERMRIVRYAAEKPVETAR